MRKLINKLFPKKIEEPIKETEYRIREVVYKDRTEYFPEGKYDKRSKLYCYKEWQTLGDGYHIMFEKGYNTLQEAQDRIEVAKKRELGLGKKNELGQDMDVVEEKIHDDLSTTRNNKIDLIL